ncbi:MAG: TIGR04282 family arsenosugar biosynthesis glycosyltransferase [Gammaproteobacteria bacterium]
MKFPNAKILIFCKAPIPGEVKTRLTPHLTSDQAAELYKQLANETINLVIQSKLCNVELWCSPDTKHSFLKSFELDLKQQQGNDLGERMSNAFSASLESFSSVVLIGTDSPSMTIDLLDRTLSELENKSDVVIAPAEDGGYTLIGMNNHYGSIFENVLWGSERVFDQTIEKINALNLNLHLLPMQWDLDRPDDLKRYLDSKNNKS